MPKDPNFPVCSRIRTSCPDTSYKATPWLKAQHEGALTPPCIVWKTLQVPHTAQQVACHPVNNSKGKRSSIPPHKTRPDSPVPTLKGPCDPRQIQPQGSQERNPEVPASTRDDTLFHCTKARESLEAPPNSTVSLTSQNHPEKLPEVTCTSRGNPGFQLRPKKDVVSPSLMHLEARFPYHDWRAMSHSPSPRPWRPDFARATLEAP